jgi:hypothetical protein
MSDHWLLLVPTEPAFRPEADRAEAAERMLASYLPDADEVTTEESADPRFYDPGANWDGVACAACGLDAEDWWGEAMDVAAEKGFADLTVTTPCCATQLSLNDLHYGGAAAFGRFALRVMNPGVAALGDERQQALEELVGRPLRLVWRRL